MAGRRHDTVTDLERVAKVVAHVSGADEDGALDVRGAMRAQNSDAVTGSGTTIAARRKWDTAPVGACHVSGRDIADDHKPSRVSVHDPTVRSGMSVAHQVGRAMPSGYTRRRRGPFGP